jgi:hypothetical protein
MPIPVSGQVGPAALGDGVTTQPFRQGRSSELVVTELHGRFYEQASRNALYSAGMTVTSISNATFTSATTGVTATPIIGLWNPTTSGVNLVVLQATLSVVLTALQNTGGGPYIWMYSLGNSAISTGITPINRKTLLASGSNARAFAGTALTGMTGTLALLTGSALGGGNLYNIASLSTAAGFSTTFNGSVENLDGSIIVPPGGVVALMATTTPVGHSASSGIIWEEIPV